MTEILGGSGVSVLEGEVLEVVGADGGELEEVGEWGV